LRIHLPIAHSWFEVHLEVEWGSRYSIAECVEFAVLSEWIESSRQNPPLDA
jgi:hypothetical protein